MSTIQQKPRRGAAAVELALVAPLLFLLLFGIIEFGRAMMVQQMLTNATREGARHAALPMATEGAVKTSIAESLHASSIVVPLDNISVSPNPASTFNNEQITVAIEVPFSEVSWIPGTFLQGVTLRASTRMRSERLE